MKAKTAEYYDKLYSRKKMSERQYYPLWKKLILRLIIHEVKNVLDIGCGTGSLGKRIEGCDIKYSGFDFSEVAVKMAENLSVWKSDIDDAANYTNKYDAYISMEVLEHISNDYIFASILPKGSLFYFSVPTFSGEAHLRHFKRLWDVDKRYGKIYDIKNIWRIKKWFLVESRIK